MPKLVFLGDKHDDPVSMTWALKRSGINLAEKSHALLVEWCDKSTTDPKLLTPQRYQEILEKLCNQKRSSEDERTMLHLMKGSNNSVYMFDVFDGKANISQVDEKRQRGMAMRIQKCLLLDRIKEKDYVIVVVGFSHLSVQECEDIGWPSLSKGDIIYDNVTEIISALPRLGAEYPPLIPWLYKM